MAGDRAEFIARAARRRGLRRLVVAISIMTLVASLSVPLASASTRTRTHSFGNISRVQKSVGEVRHTDSMLSVAHEAALHPRQAKAPTLNLPAPNLGKQVGPRPLTSVASGTATTALRPLIVTPDVEASTTFAGLAEVESGSVIPADPWVAVNSSFVVQAVNSMIRISNRAGTPIASIPNDAFFAIEPDHYPSDPRIIWDATHGKWVAEIVFFSGDLQDDGFVLAISDGADPTQGWNMWPIFFGPFLPDYPSLASSNDKVVVADDLFDSSPSFLGLDLNTFKWSELLAGTSVFDRFCDDSSFAHPRAAQVLSSSNDVHVVMESTDGSSDQNYVRITGSGTCAETTDYINLTTDLSFDPLLELGPPPAPRQPGPDTIDNATDGRYTDAVWQNNKLYWVSTFPYTYDGGATWNDQVVLWNTTTSSVIGTTPAGFNYTAIRPGDGIDAYMGGIGLTRAGHPILSYSQSSSADPIAFYAAEVFSVSAGGGSVGSPVLLDTSEDAISGERWGDYAGVAMDPVGTGSVWVTHMLAAGDGSWRTTVARMLVDNDLPSAPGIPTASAVTGTKLGLLPKYKLAWGAATDAMSGTVVYQLEQNVDGGGFAYAGTYSGTSTTRSLNRAHTYQFRVAAIDALGNMGAYATGPVLHVSTAQSPTSKTGTWHTSSSSNYYGGTTWYASAAGATATYKTTGVRSIAFVTTKAASRGSFKVYIDGVYKGTISTYSTTTAFRQVVYQYSWSTAGTHSIKIVLKGTSGHPRVDFDAVLLLK
jgi:hypothetical protein